MDQLGAWLAELGDVLLELDEAGVCVSCSGASDLPFADPAALIGRSIADAWPQAAASGLLQAFSAAQRDGKTSPSEHVLPSARGDRYYEARFGKLDHGHVVMLLRDVHDRRIAESKLRESEARFRLMADYAPVMLWKSGTDGECDFFNRGWLEFTGRPLETHLGVAWASDVHPEDFQGCMDTYLSSFVERKSFRMEYRLRRWDGRYRVILDTGVPRFDPQGVLLGYIGSCIDVSEMREASEKIHSLNDELRVRLAEREELLRELHHRVKNNLQLISSMLSLQARVAGPEAREMVEDNHARIRSLALAHDRLCESEGVSHIELGGYVKELAELLFHALGDASRIALQIESEPLQLGPDRAIPCGLALNELITNALKHAFPGDRRGVLRVALRREAAARACIEVADDGVGLATSVSLERPERVGLDLVVALTHQLGGQLSVARAHGTRFTLSFPLEEAR